MNRRVSGVLAAVLSGLLPALLIAPGRADCQMPELPGIEDATVVTWDAPEFASRVRVVYWSGGEGRAARILEVLEANPLLPGLPESVPDSVSFYLAPNLEIWDALTGGQVPEWGAGVAVPGASMAVLPLFQAAGGGPAARDRTALHEWAHLGLHEYLEGLRIPRWFDEGYAEWVSGGWDTREAWRLRAALTRRGVAPLDSIALVWPVERTRAQTAYLLSASAVEFLVSGSGERGLRIFLERWRELESFEDAFRDTFGETSASFEDRWIEHVRERYGWILLFTETALFWLVVGSVLLVMIRVRIQRKQERLARLRALQLPSRPAYWAANAIPTPPIGGFDSDLAGRTRIGD